MLESLQPTSIYQWRSHMAGLLPDAQASGTPDLRQSMGPCQKSCPFARRSQAPCPGHTLAMPWPHSPGATAASWPCRPRARWSARVQGCATFSSSACCGHGRGARRRGRPPPGPGPGPRPQRPPACGSCGHERRARAQRHLGGMRMCEGQSRGERGDGASVRAARGALHDHAARSRRQISSRPSSSLGRRVSAGARAERVHGCGISWRNCSGACRTPLAPGDHEQGRKQFQRAKGAVAPQR